MSKKNQLSLIITLILVLVLSASFYATYKAQKIQPPKEDDFISRIDAQNYEQIKEYIDSNDNRMIVIGQTGCHFCEMFLSSLESVSNDLKFTYMYIDIKKLDDTDRKDFLNSDLIIPSKCTDGGDKKLNEGFGTPLTLFTKNNSAYDCIRGYKDSDTLKNILAESNFTT